MLNDQGHGNVTNGQISPFGSTHKLELGRENFMKTKLYVLFNVQSDLAPKSKKGMSKALSHVLAKDWQAHHARSKSGIPYWLEA